MGKTTDKVRHLVEDVARSLREDHREDRRALRLKIEGERMYVDGRLAELESRGHARSRNINATKVDAVRIDGEVVRLKKDQEKTEKTRERVLLAILTAALAGVLAVGKRLLDLLWS